MECRICKCTIPFRLLVKEIQALLWLLSFHLILGPRQFLEMHLVNGVSVMELCANVGKNPATPPRSPQPTCGINCVCILQKCWILICTWKGFATSACSHRRWIWAPQKVSAESCRDESWCCIRICLVAVPTLPCVKEHPYGARKPPGKWPEVCKEVTHWFHMLQG